MVSELNHDHRVSEMVWSRVILPGKRRNKCGALAYIPYSSSLYQNSINCQLMRRITQLGQAKEKKKKRRRYESLLSHGTYLGWEITALRRRIPLIFHANQVSHFCSNYTYTFTLRKPNYLERAFLFHSSFPVAIVFKRVQTCAQQHKSLWSIKGQDSTMSISSSANSNKLLSYCLSRISSPTSILKHRNLESQSSADNH